MLKVWGNRWRLVLPLSVVILVSFLVTYNLYGLPSKSKTQDPVSVEGTHFPLKLTMTLNDTELKEGEPLNILLSLENTGNETLTLYFADGGDRFDFTIYTESGACVYRYGYDTVYPQIHIPEQMRLGDTRNLTREWGQVTNAIYDPNHDPHTYYNAVPPGTYQIKGAFFADTLRFNMSTPEICFEISV
jgi:hypothetical protein